MTIFNNINWKEQGLTLIEIVITMAILGAIISAIYAFYLTGLQGWHRSIERIEYQQSARIAMDKIIDELLTAQMTEIRYDNNRTLYYVVDKNGTPAIFRFRLSNRQLVIERREDDYKSYNVVALGIKDLVFLIENNGTVTITVTAGENTNEVTLTGSVRPRNQP